MVIRVGLLALVAACRVSAVFTCEMDTECRDRGAVGHCDRSVGFCAFNDATCSSGFRYADSAGDGLASACTDSMSDAGVDDASTFDPATCPASYNGALSGFTHAKYVVLPAAPAGAGFAAQIQLCEDGMPGATHAVIVDSAAKASALATFIGSGRHWVGLVQRPTATAVGSDWITFVGEPVDASLWAGTDTEPDDANSSESDHAEQAGGFGPKGLYDQPASASLPVVCECDGRQSTDEALALVQAVAD